MVGAYCSTLDNRRQLGSWGAAGFGSVLKMEQAGLAGIGEEAVRERGSRRALSSEEEFRKGCNDVAVD